MAAMPAWCDEPLAILERYAADYTEDPNAEDMVFGVRVDDAWYTVDARGDAVHARAGRPGEPTFYFETDADTLGRLDAGELNALTAAGKARASDFAPLDFGVMDGFEPAPGLGRRLRRLVFHFWTRGQPEVIPFGPAHTRTIHGGDGSVLFYQDGFRSAYFHIRPGQHVNEDAGEQSNPFPSLLVVIDGRVNGRINGVELELTSGNAYFIPAGHAHEFWLPPGAPAPAEALLLMFGEGA